MNAQRATKYFSSTMYQWFMAQVEGSPLLPRDVMTMMLYNRLYVFDLDDGRSLWPMPSIYDVSEALDVIAKIPGQTIVRGPNNWMPIQSPGPQLATKWTILDDHTFNGSVGNYDITGIGGWNEYQFQMIDVQTANSGVRSLELSVDNGANFFGTAGDYKLISATGVASNSSGIGFHTTNATSARSGVVRITGNDSGAPPIIENVNNSAATRLFFGSSLPINAARFRCNTGGLLNAGRLITMGR